MSIVVRFISPDDQARDIALRMIVSADSREESIRADILQRQFEEDAKSRSLGIDLLFGAFEGARLHSACLAVESPGSAAMVLSAVAPEVGQSAFNHLGEALILLIDSTRRRGIALLESLVTTTDTHLTRALEFAGFRKLTRLCYLQRELSLPHPPRLSNSVLNWVSFREDEPEKFHSALSLSYVDSLDCPELTGLRTPSEILAGHRAAGRHDPALWTVAELGGRPVGVILLSLCGNGVSCEVVYLGVSRSARGTGVADALMERAVMQARGASAKELILAVDSRNAPARRLYDRWNFRAIGVRDAWIATLRAATTCAESRKE